MSSGESATQLNLQELPATQRGGRGRGRGRGRGIARGADNNKETSPNPHVQQVNGLLHSDLQNEIATSQSTLAIRPSSLAPASSAEPSSAEVSGVENGQARREGRRGRGRGNGNARGGHRAGAEVTNDFTREHTPGPPSQQSGRGQARIGSSRQFGGRLTTDDEQSPRSGLKADAPVFVPAQPHQTRGPKRGRGSNTGPSASRPVQAKDQRARRASIKKSQAPDIATRTHEDIANSVYECPICTNEVAPNSRVWSCETCWTVFHLSCIKKWSTNEGSAQAQQRAEDGQMPPPRQWRCPGCNLPKDTLPSSYTCWCEKESDPRPVPGVPPHSCGQTCSKSRLLPKRCLHPCELLCHAGPCPPCTHIGPVQSCFCGKNATTMRCVDTNYDSGWSCGQTCGDSMPCGIHSCPKSCHEGLCGACEIPMNCRCYCGKSQIGLPCCDREDEQESQRATTTDNEDTEIWIGTFDCGNKCQRDFDCGKHQCKKKCHPQDLGKPHCPQSPDVVFHCPCGKTPLQTISSDPRKTCEDPVPNCDKECWKQLACGHPCQQICHSGICAPCLLTVEIVCRCGRTKFKTICQQGSSEQPQCMRACKAHLNCGRHECGERCCTGERKAADRQATKRKLKPLGASRIIDEGIEAEHICTRTCGRPLKCGKHTCPNLCHKGPCHTCLEAIFEEIYCHCGKTTLQPPLPCGTLPPPCRFDCERPRPCGHPRISHNCHGDDEQCPKCPYLSQKPCLCGKKTLKNQPCFAIEVRCGEVCGQKLRCGSHFCRKQCHRPGKCDDAASACQQPCGKAKKVCGHPCEQQCHAPSPCKEDKPCPNKSLVTCECQHLKQEVKCNASKSSEGNSKKTLDCDDECARLARNQKLARALNIDATKHTDDHVPYSADTLNMYRESVKWAQTQEREFRVFAADENEKRLRFSPMKASQRAFLHLLAIDFGLETESLDPEPHRHILLLKTPKFVACPIKTLAECVRIRMVEEANVAAVEPHKPSKEPSRHYDGFLLTSPRFGLTLDELRAEFAATFNSTPGLTYDVSFLPSEEIIIKARPVSASTAISLSALEASIKVLKPALSSITTASSLAGSIQLCCSDVYLNITRREIDEDDPATNGGWSQVVAKGPAPRTWQPYGGAGQKTMYTVLGSKLKDAKNKREEAQKSMKAEVVDDWEEEVKKEEDEQQAVKTKGAKDIDEIMADMIDEQ